VDWKDTFGQQREIVDKHKVTDIVYVPLQRSRSNGTFSIVLGIREMRISQSSSYGHTRLACGSELYQDPDPSSPPLVESFQVIIVLFHRTGLCLPDIWVNKRSCTA
jgi:hypothetical protein